MTLLLATLLPGLFLVVLGTALALNNSAIVAMLKALPRSQIGAGLFFGGGAAWFIYNIAHLSQADLIFVSSPKPLVIGFSVLAVASFWFIPDFLAVRGLAILTQLCAWPLLMAGYMNFDHPQIYVQKVALFLAVIAALYLGALPYRLRDFFQWLFAVPGRARLVGGSLASYGLLLTALAFSY